MISTRTSICASILTFLSTALFAADKQTFTPTTDYKVLTIEGWKVLVNKELTDDHPDLSEKTLKLLESHLYRITRVVPANALAEIRQVPIWVEYKNRPEKHSCMCYHPGRKWLVDNNFNPDKTDSVELAGAENFLKWTVPQPWMILHELAHGYHDRVIKHGHPELNAAYRNAKKSGTYDKVLHINGSMRKAYAMNNTQEYFAEATEAFVGTNDFYPFVKSELKKHDPQLYDLLKKLWAK